MVRASGSTGRRSCSGASYKEWQNFMGSSVADMYEKPIARRSAKQIDIKEEEKEIKQLLADVQRLGTSSRPWKERKAIENQNVVALGGKPTKKHRTPLSVAIPAMKNKKKREEKQREEGLILGKFALHQNKKKVEKRKPEDRVLRTSEGHFRKGVLDVKHLLRSNNQTKGDDDGDSYQKTSKGNNKRKGKKGKRKGR